MTMNEESSFKRIYKITSICPYHPRSISHLGEVKVTVNKMLDDLLKSLRSTLPGSGDLCVTLMVQEVDNPSLKLTMPKPLSIKESSTRKSISVKSLEREEHAAH